MAIQELSRQALFITLPRDPQRGNELDVAAQLTGVRPAHHIIIDLSRVESMPPATVCNLILLEGLLSRVGRKLILCSVKPKVTDVLRRVGLDHLFRFAKDGPSAILSLEAAKGARR